MGEEHSQSQAVLPSPCSASAVFLNKLMQHTGSNRSQIGGGGLGEEHSQSQAVLPSPCSASAVFLNKLIQRTGSNRSQIGVRDG